MIVNFPWTPLPQADKHGQHRDQPNPLNRSAQDRNADFLAELLKLSLGTSAIQSLNGVSGSQEQSAPQLPHAPLAVATPGSLPAPFAAKLGTHPEGFPMPSPAALTALVQIMLEQPPPNPDPGDNAHALRRAVSAYTPRYSTDGFRQKIDFSARPPEQLAARPTTPLAAQSTAQSAVQPAVHREQSASSLASHPDQTLETVGKLAPLQPGTPFQEHDPSAALGDRASSPPDAEPFQPGALAARFESMNRPDAIGFDRRGGTCYGTYQLSSRMGGLDNFLKFLDTEAPVWAQGLRAAGPGNTNGRSGAMPARWQRIHQENPERFAALQHAFARQAYYEPAAREVRRRTGLDPDNATPALREVLWSTAVQHGVHGAANIFQHALDAAATGRDTVTETDLIQAVYAERSTRFSGSTQSVRSAVHERFHAEMQLALALLPEDRDVLV